MGPKQAIPGWCCSTRRTAEEEKGQEQRTAPGLCDGRGISESIEGAKENRSTYRVERFLVTSQKEGGVGCLLRTKPATNTLPFLRSLIAIHLSAILIIR